METKAVENLDNDYKIITDQKEINRILDNIGADYDPDSIVLEDSYGSLFVKIDDGDYSEVWGVHNNTPRDHHTAHKLL